MHQYIFVLVSIRTSIRMSIRTFDRVRQVYGDWLIGLTFNVQLHPH